MKDLTLQLPKALFATALAGAALAAAPSALAVTYRVGPTQMYRTPCAVITGAPLVAGDIIEVEAGTYRDACRVEVSGTAARPIILRGLAGARPVIDGAGMNLNGDGGVPRAVFQFSDASHWRVEHLEIRNASNTLRNAAGIRVTEGSLNVVMDDLSLHDNQNGLSTDTGVTFTLSNSEVYLNGTTGTAAPIGSNLFLAGTSGRLIGNVVRDSRSGQNLRSHLTYAEILYNQFLRASEYDLDFTHNYKNESNTSRIVFIGNTLVRSATATNFEQCFLFGTEMSATGRPAQTLYVYNNTFILVSVRNRLLRGINERMGTVQMTFVNNVIHTTSAATAAGPGVVVDNATGTLMTGTNNWATLGMILIPTTTVLRWNSGADPLFTSATDWTPRAGSPLLDAAATPPAYLNEMGMMVNGTPSLQFNAPLGTIMRPLRGALDIGAFEGVTTAVVDAGVPDAGIADAGPIDSGVRPDTGIGPVDSGPGPMDTGPGPTDTGPGPADTGPGPMDTGPGPMDTGPGPSDTGPGPNDTGPGPGDSGPGDGGGPGDDGGPGDGGANDSGLGPGDGSREPIDLTGNGSCDCNTVGVPTRSNGLVSIFGLIALALVRRRRR